MQIPTTIYDLISWGESQEISHRNFHNDAFIYDNQSDRLILIPHDNIIKKYLYYMEDYLVTIEMNDVEYSKYAYNPKGLSEQLYGTTEYWSVLLMINNCVSKIDFDKRVIDVMDPKRIDQFINEILILEEVI